MWQSVRRTPSLGLVKWSGHDPGQGEGPRPVVVFLPIVYPLASPASTVMAAFKRAPPSPGQQSDRQWHQQPAPFSPSSLAELLL